MKSSGGVRHLPQEVGSKPNIVFYKILREPIAARNILLLWVQ